MNTKIVAQLDDDGFLIGTTLADESPLEPGVFLLPGNCVDVEPLPHVDGKMQKFDGNTFIYVDIPQPEPAPQPTEEELVAQANAEILAQIVMIEQSKQPRAVREAAIGMDGAVDRLKAIDAEIAVLRAQLIKL